MDPYYNINLQLQIVYQWSHLWKFQRKEGVKARGSYLSIDLCACYGLPNMNTLI